MSSVAAIAAPYGLSNMDLFFVLQRRFYHERDALAARHGPEHWAAFTDLVTPAVVRATKDEIEQVIGTDKVTYCARLDAQQSEVDHDHLRDQARSMSLEQWMAVWYKANDSAWLAACRAATSTRVCVCVTLNEQ